MGAAKRRKERFFKDHPNCCLCGGTVQATTIEHAPPKVLFVNKQRLKGLEFPACERCNSGSADSDQIVALFTFTMSTTHKNTPEGYLKKLIQGVKNNQPEVIELFLEESTDIAVKISGKTKLQKRIKISTELFRNWCNPWAAKQGYSLWYEHTKNILNDDARVCVYWYTNDSIMNGKYPKDLIKQLDGEGKLKQGKVSSEAQYWYKFEIGEVEGKQFGCFLLFLHDSSIALVYVFNDDSLLSESTMALPRFGTCAQNGIIEITTE